MIMQVKTPNEKMAALEMPHLKPIKQLAFNREDTLIICAGFEERALGGLRMLKQKNLCHLIIINYLPHIDKNRHDEIYDFYKTATGTDPIELIYDRENPAGFGLNLVENLAKRSGRIYIDVPAMSRLLIVQLLSAFNSKAKMLKKCFVLYTEALEYPPTENQAREVLKKTASDSAFTALFLSSGVFEVTIVPELSSITMAASQTRLITFPTFDTHQFSALRAELQPSRFTFIEGNPPHSQLAWRKNCISEINRLNEVERSDRYATSTLDYRETLGLLNRLYKRSSLKERLLVSPTGSKMQTVAVGIFRAFITDVQIVYPTPDGFVAPDKYTKGIGVTYLLPLSAFDSVS